MINSGGPLELVFSNIEKALQVQLWFPAIAVSLSLPDICAALESDNGEASGSKYKAWFNKWIVPKFNSFTADDCYYLRCGIVHQSRAHHPKIAYNRILFTSSSQFRVAEANIGYNGGTNENYISLDTAMFCSRMVDSARKWFASNREEANVLRNIEHVVRFRPEGLPPNIVGVPLIA